MSRESMNPGRDVRADADTSEATGTDEWERMVAAFRSAAPAHADAPAWLEERVMSEIEALPQEGVLRRLWQWLSAPAPVRISPLAAGLVAASFALVLALPGPVREPTTAAAGGPSTTVVYVQFLLDAPAAQSVAVAGDFTDWAPDFPLEDVDGDGVWTGRVPIRPGVHSYMFLIDGSQWETDPNAERYQDDGFGNRNAVVAVVEGD